ncbi:MAG: L-histidine N(alpha)-methyltransferase [Planctomycetes bacterium]|nr:L-histidine N(alpha)-methyltransferase [Planctomycetota bacterium]
MPEPQLHDLAPSTGTFLDDVRRGLSAEPKSLPCQYLYDETGALLFEAITTLDEYYPTRTELRIMERHAREMAHALGPRVRLVEPGSGSLTKVRTLLEHLREPREFVPIDISREQLESEARILAIELPALRVRPICADFTSGFELPAADRAVARTVVYYPGSTIGNFEPDDAVAFLRRMADWAGDGGALLVGVDLAKPLDVLLPAYDDPRGVTAAFIRNLLSRINRELGGDFDERAFAYRASYERTPSRVVLQLVSRRAQRVCVADERYDFEVGEPITVEYSHKPSLEDFARLARRARLRVERVWTDERRWFSVQLLSAG